MTAREFIRRFRSHVLPRGFHRIRHYGLLAGSSRKHCLAQSRDMLEVTPPPEELAADETSDQRPPCPCCGGTMVITKPSHHGASHGRLRPPDHQTGKTVHCPA